MCTCGFVLQSDWYHQTKAAEVNNISPRMLPGSLLPLFLRREPGNEAKASLEKPKGAEATGCRLCQHWGCVAEYGQ